VGDDVEVCPIELPGRQTRWQESPFERLDPLVNSLATALSSELGGRFALFGHSMGALVAFELTRTLRRRGEGEPETLFVSAGADAAVVRADDRGLQPARPARRPLRAGERAGQGADRDPLAARRRCLTHRGRAGVEQVGGAGGPSTAAAIAPGRARSPCRVVLD